MSLPASQQRVLDTIESALQHREPRLASMFAIFTRLNSNERVPRNESLEARPWWASSRLWRPRWAIRPAFFVSLAIILILSAAILGLTESGPACMPGNGPHGPVAAGSHSANCPLVPGFRNFGRG
jgi:hypothetical protein